MILKITFPLLLFFQCVWCLLFPFLRSIYHMMPENQRKHNNFRRNEIIMSSFKLETQFPFFFFKSDLLHYDCKKETISCNFLITHCQFYQKYIYFSHQRCCQFQDLPLILNLNSSCEHFKFNHNFEGGSNYA